MLSLFLSFKQDQPLKIRREKILKAIFRVRESERQGIPQRRFIILKNGDFLAEKSKMETL